MTIRPQDAWRKALNCTLLADQAMDELARKTLIVIRNSWIAIANDGEVLGTTDPEAVLLVLDDTIAAHSRTLRPHLRPLAIP
jgi:hypothetical protein